MLWRTVRLAVTGCYRSSRRRHSRRAVLDRSKRAWLLLRQRCPDPRALSQSLRTGDDAPAWSVLVEQPDHSTRIRHRQNWAASDIASPRLIGKKSNIESQCSFILPVVCYLPMPPLNDTAGLVGGNSDVALAAKVRRSSLQSVQFEAGDRRGRGMRREQLHDNRHNTVAITL
jgi:hypothetical protein